MKLNLLPRSGEQTGHGDTPLKSQHLRGIQGHPQLHSDPAQKSSSRTLNRVMQVLYWPGGEMWRAAYYLSSISAFKERIRDYLTRSWLFWNSMLFAEVWISSFLVGPYNPQDSCLRLCWERLSSYSRKGLWLAQPVPQEATVGPVLAGTEPGGLPQFQEGTYGMETKTGLKSKWITTFICPESHWHEIRGQQRKKDISLE